MKHPGIRIGIIVCAVAGLALSACLYAYLYFETGSLTDRAVSDRTLLKNSEAARLQSKDIVALADQTARDRARLPGLFIPAENGVEAIKAIESVGTVSGASVDISSINAADPGDSGMGTISAAVSIGGSWKQVTEALALFETLPYDRTINQLSLRSTGGGKDSRWQADFTLSVTTLTHR